MVLAQRLRDALARLNPALPAEALDDAFRKLTRPEGADLIVRNRALHRLLVDGVTVEYRDAEGSIRGAQARVIDFDDPAGNDWLAVNQFSVVENKHSRRPDVVLFVNGLPLAVVELKNAADENATIWSAFQQLQTYKAEMPSLFAPNALLAVSDGVEARVGTLSAGREWFKPWRTIAGETLADAHLPELQVVIEGLCAPRRFLDLLRDFIVFEDDGGRIVKKMAGYHQFHAVQVAVGETLRAAELHRAADRRGRARGPLRGRPQAGRQARRPARGRGLAHAGLGQEPDDGLLRRPHHPRAGDGEPDARRAHRPQRPRRPALRHLLALPATCCASRRCRPRAARTCASCSAWRRAGWCSPPSTSSSPRRRATGTRRSPSAATSW